MSSVAPLKVTTLNDVKVYNCSAGKTVPQWMEDYANNTAEALQGLYKFLRLEEIPLNEIQDYLKTSTIVTNRNRGYEKAGDMMPKTRKILTDFYRPYNEKLAVLLGDKGFLFEE
jgi:N-acetylgalactosamine 4-sulfate 6-O-sulfotransferase